LCPAFFSGSTALTIHVPTSQHVPCSNGQQDVPVVADILARVVAMGRLVEYDPPRLAIAFQGTDYQSGWTFRAHASDAEMDNMALLFTDRMYSDPVYVMSEGHYARCSPDKKQARRNYRRFFLRAGVDIRYDADGRGWVAVPVSFIRLNIDEFVSLLIGFA
jgi:hypothetical protein